MSVYLDANILMALFSADKFSQTAFALVARERRTFFSDFGAAEFASALARRVRTGERNRNDARAAFAAFDAWTTRGGNTVSVTSDDIAEAATYLRRLDLNLRTPDAIHIAIAQRLGATLATFDERMADCARSLGLTVANA